MIQKIVQNKLLLITLLLAVSGTVVALKHSFKQSITTKIGFIHMDQIMGQDLEKSAQEWRDRVSELEKEIEKRSSEIKVDEQRFKKEVSDFQSKQGKFMSEDSRNKKRDELAQLKNSIEIKYQSLKEFAGRTEQKIQMEMAQKIKDAVDHLAKMQGWDAVMPAYFFVSDRCDVTTDVLAILNDAYAKEKIAKKAPEQEAKVPAKAVKAVAPKKA